MSILNRVFLVESVVLASILSVGCGRDHEPTESSDRAEITYDVAPIPLDIKKPDYPKEAKEARIEGKVFLKILVGSDGSVKEADVLKSSGSDLLDQAALESALSSLFKPALRDGEPVEVWTSLPYHFLL